MKGDMIVYLRWKAHQIANWQAPSARKTIRKLGLNTLRIFGYALLLLAGVLYNKRLFVLLATSLFSSFFLLALYDYGLGKHRAWDRARVRQKAGVKPIEPTDNTIEDRRSEYEGQSNDSNPV